MTTDHRTDHGGLIDWRRLGRRLRVTVVALVAAAVALWVGTGLAHGAVRLEDLWGYVGLALAGLFVAEIVFVGGAALRGMLRAGERGERLAGNDVGLLPPQLRRRR